MAIASTCGAAVPERGTSPSVPAPVTEGSSRPDETLQLLEIERGLPGQNRTQPEGHPGRASADRADARPAAGNRLPRPQSRWYRPDAGNRRRSDPAVARGDRVSRGHPAGAAAHPGSALRGGTSARPRADDRGGPASPQQSACHPQAAGAGPRPAGVIDWMLHWMKRGLGAYQAALPQGTRFSCGDAPSLADVCLVPQLYNARRWGLDLSPLSRLVEIETLCLSLPAFADARPEVQPDAEP